jgi:competence protein ComEC
MDRKVFSISILFGTVCLLGIVFFTLPKDAISGTLGKARFYMLDIGQGDSFLIVAPNGGKMLVDGGKDAKVLTELSKVLSIGDRYIDVMIATHPDADHIGGLSYVLGKYNVGLFLTSEVDGSTKTFADLMRTLDKKKIPSYYARHGMSISFPKSDFGKASDTSEQNHFDILFPDRPTNNWETNNASVVGKLSFGSRTALFTGDSPISIEHYLSQAIPKVLDVDILKLGHHGSKYSSSTEYLQATSPSLALISAGVANSYGHPHQEVLDRLAALHISYISTQTAGIVTLTVSSDGGKWEMKKEK